MQKKISVIHSGSTIESLYTLFPLIISRFSSHLQFLHVDSKEAEKAEGDCVILVRVFKGNQLFDGEDQKKRDYINDLKKRFQRVIMLDDGAGSDSLHFEYMDLVDLYYKGKLLKDRSHYLRPMYGRQLFTDYYHKNFGIDDDKVKIREVPQESSVLNKLKVSWNLGYGMYPMPAKTYSRLAKGATRLNGAKWLRPWFIYHYKKMLRQINTPVDLHVKLNKVQARFGNRDLPNTIAYQRKLFMQKCAHTGVVLTGSIDSDAYNREIKKVAAVLSPFGWGEVCFRDFEAVANGCLLIKPAMDHIETWPDIYINSKTYVPVDWDGNDLVQTINDVSKNIFTYDDIVRSAKEKYKKALLEIDDRVQHFLEEASGTKIN